MSAELGYAHLLKRRPIQDRSIRRVEAILDAAADLLRTHEPQDVTIRDLAAHAAVPTGTVYQFFDDKEAVLQALAVRFVGAMPEVLDTTLAGARDDWAETVGNVIDAYAALVREHPAIRRLWLSGAMDPATRSIERETDATLASRLGAQLCRQAGTTRGTQTQWETLVALINGLLAHAFTVDPDGDAEALGEARRAARAYTAAVLAG